MRLFIAVIISLVFALSSLAQDDSEYPACEGNLYGEFENSIFLRNRNDRVEDMQEIFNEFLDDEISVNTFISEVREWAVFSRSALIRFPIEELPQCDEYIRLDQAYNDLVMDMFLLSAMLEVEIDWGNSAPEHLAEQRNQVTDEYVDHMIEYNALYRDFGHRSDN